MKTAASDTILTDKTAVPAAAVSAAVPTPAPWLRLLPWALVVAPAACA